MKCYKHSGEIIEELVSKCLVKATARRAEGPELCTLKAEVITVTHF